jgi:hypothetical protein
MTPSSEPSLFPSYEPSFSPSMTPSSEPFFKPTLEPSSNPSFIPTVLPITTMPSKIPTLLPSIKPTIKSALQPSVTPSYQPTAEPYNESYSPSIVTSITPILSITPSPVYLYAEFHVIQILKNASLYTVQTAHGTSTILSAISQSSLSTSSVQQYDAKIVNFDASNIILSGDLRNHRRLLVEPMVQLNFNVKYQFLSNFTEGYTALSAALTNAFLYQNFTNDLRYNSTEIGLVGLFYAYTDTTPIFGSPYVIIDTDTPTLSPTFSTIPSVSSTTPVLYSVTHKLNNNVTMSSGVIAGLVIAGVLFLIGCIQFILLIIIIRRKSKVGIMDSDTALKSEASQNKDSLQVENTLKSNRTKEDKPILSEPLKSDEPVFSGIVILSETNL